MEDWVAQLGDYAKTALRPIEGTAKLDGLNEQVQIVTDTWGVPHVYAQNRDDLYFAQGYLHATERLFQTELIAKLAQGRLSELLGQFTLPLDKFFRTLGFGRMVSSWLEDIDEDTERIGRPYFEGFLAGADSLPRPVEYQILDLEPEIPQDFKEATRNAFSVALMMAFNLSTNRDFELLRALLAQKLGPERARRLAPLIGPVHPTAVPTSDTFPTLVKTLNEASAAAGSGPGIGSNNWVLSGQKTTTGMPLLANDPHLKIQMPGTWMEMHLASPDFEVTGVSLPGVPCIVIGHNRNIAWGFTNTGSDVEDLYLERLNEDGTSYEFQGKWYPVETTTEKILVRGDDEPRPHEVRSTRHGPLLTSIIEGNINPVVKEDEIKEAFAWRWYHQDVKSSTKQLEAINEASSWTEFREAVRTWTSPGQNMVFADTDGNIGYQYTGIVPKRNGLAGPAPVPGWTGEHEWEGTIPFEDLPNVFNPAQGYIATANNRMVDLDYPHYLTNDWEPPFRINRITSLLNGKEKFSADDIAEVQKDVHSGIAEGLVPFLTAANPSGERSAEALKHIATWDLQMAADSTGASIFVMWITKLAESLFLPKLGDDLYGMYFRVRGWTTLWAYDTILDILKNPEAFWVGGDGSNNGAARDQLIALSLDEACAELESTIGPDPASWQWGKLHRLHIQHPLASAMPDLNPLMSVGPHPSSGGDDTINRGAFNPGEGYLQHTVSSCRVIFDLDDFDKSRSVIPAGNSGNPASPFYRDQTEKWLACEYHPMPFSRKSVDEHAKGRMNLDPA